MRCENYEHRKSQPHMLAVGRFSHPTACKVIAVFSLYAHGSLTAFRGFISFKVYRADNYFTTLCSIFFFFFHVVYQAFKPRNHCHLMPINTRFPDTLSLQVINWIKFKTSLEIQFRQFLLRASLQRLHQLTWKISLPQWLNASQIAYI